MKPGPVATTVCRNCGRPPVTGRTRCGACLGHWRRYGTERPAGPLFGAGPETCQTCGQPTAPRYRCRGECRRCTSYRQRVGQARPPTPTLLYQRNVGQCIVCGRTAREYHRQRCSACWSYWRRNGRDWPTDTQRPRRILHRVNLAKTARRWATQAPAPGWQFLPGTGWVPGASYCRPGEDFGKLDGCAVCARRVECRAVTAGEAVS